MPTSPYYFIRCDPSLPPSKFTNLEAGKIFTVTVFGRDALSNILLKNYVIDRLKNGNTDTHLT